jgi:uncharacterized protein (TIGR04255 family)
MPFDLPAPSTEKLSRSPLTTVVCQVRHDRLATVSDAKHVLEVHEALHDLFPVLEDNATQSVTITGGPGGIQPLVTSPEKGWQFRSPDGAWSVVLMPEFFALETSRYEHWDDFRDRADRTTRAIAGGLAPSMERRIGLRFVDRLTERAVERPIDWRGRVEDALLGPVAHPALGPSVIAAQQLLQLDAGDDVQVVLRQGCIPEAEGVLVYVLDHDCARERVQPFDADRVLETIELLHLRALQVFQAAITPEYFQELKDGVT